MEQGGVVMVGIAANVSFHDQSLGGPLDEANPRNASRHRSLSLQESRDCRKMAKMNAEADNPQSCGRTWEALLAEVVAGVSSTIQHTQINCQSNNGHHGGPKLDRTLSDLSSRFSDSLLQSRLRKCTSAPEADAATWNCSKNRGQRGRSAPPLSRSNPLPKRLPIYPPTTASWSREQPQPHSDALEADEEQQSLLTTGGAEPAGSDKVCWKQVLRAERAQRRSLQERLDEAQKNYAESAYLKEQLEMVQSLFESENRKRQQLEQRLQEVKEPEEFLQGFEAAKGNQKPRYIRKGRPATPLVWSPQEKDPPEGDQQNAGADSRKLDIGAAAKTQWMPEKEDLETMWIQLEAERTQKRKLQQRLQQTEDDAAEKASAMEEVKALRLQLEAEKCQVRKLQRMHKDQPLSKPAVYHAAVQTHTLQYLSVATQTQDSDLPCDYGTVGPSPGMRTSERELGDMQTRLVLLKQEVLRKDDTIKQMDSLIKQGESVRRKLHATVDDLARTIKQRNDTISHMDGIIKKGDFLRKGLHSTIESLTETVQVQTNTIQDMETSIKRYEITRRVLHNQLQELKGNIRVFCRIRPQLQAEQGNEAKFEYPDANLEGRTLALISSHGHGADRQPKKFFFSFDKVFGPSATQKEVFAEISQLVQSALDGFKVCIFAYGQTGSGKTHTMQGSNNVCLGSEDRGMIPLAMQKILDCVREGVGGWKYSLQASCIEIYNDKLRDLFSMHGDDNRSKALQIKHDVDGSTFVTNITTVAVEEEEVLFELLDRAARSRAIASTKFNQQSSRSHCIFTLNIIGTSEHKQVTHGTLNIVDLAGSERLDASPADVERRKEVQHINKSLSSLGDVIAALAQKRHNHVPYRNSKLTYLLQDCLGNGAKVLMFVNLSPLAEHVTETICSLRFASKVNACDMGLARRTIEDRSPATAGRAS
jgi:kinesin family protein C1